MNKNELILELENQAKEADAKLAELAKKAIASGNANVQMETVSTPFTGIQTMRVYMQEAHNPSNYIYGMRCAVAQDPTAGDCFLAILAQLAIEFKDEELKKMIANNSSAGIKTKAILGLK